MTDEEYGDAELEENGLEAEGLDGEEELGAEEQPREKFGPGRAWEELESGTDKDFSSGVHTALDRGADETLDPEVLRPGEKSAPDDESARREALEEVTEEIDAGKEVDDLLEGLWRIAADASVESLGGRGAGQALVEQNPALQVVRDRYDAGDLFPRPFGEASSAELLKGSIADMGLQVTVFIEEHQRNRERIARFYRENVAATLARLERVGAGSPMERVDLVLLPLLRADLRPERCSLPALRFCAGLRRVLEDHPAEARDKSYFFTRAALAYFVVNAKETSCLVRGAFYNHEILVYAYRLAEADPVAWEAIAERVRSASRDLTIAMEELRQLESLPEYREDIVRVRNRIKKISAAISYQHPSVGEEEMVAAASVLGKVLNRDVPREWIAMLDDMVMSSSAWAVGRDRLALAFLEVMGGLARLSMESRRHYAPSSFFNAGVSLARLGNEEPDIGVEQIARSRGSLSAIGLWWAIEVSGGEPFTTFVANDGLDCAVNLFGAVADLQWSADEKADLQRLLSVLLSFEPYLPMVKVDFLRVKNSATRIGLAAEGSETEAEALFALKESAAVVLGRLLEESGAGSFLMVEPLRGTAEATIHALQRVGMRRQSEVAELITGFNATMVELASRGQQPIETFRELYAEISGGPELTGSPLIAAHLVSEKEWRDAARDALPKEPVALSKLLRSPGALDWLTEG